jgi:flagellar biosynthetic protein FlhB
MALSLLSGFVSIHFFGKELLEGAVSILKQLLSGFSTRSMGLSPAVVSDLLAFSGGCFLMAVLPAAILASSMSAASSVLQGGLAFRSSQVAPDLSRLSLWGGITRLWHVRSLARGLFAMAKCVVVVWIAWGVVKEISSEALSSYFCAGSPAGSSPGSTETVWPASFRLLSRFGLESSLALVGLGGVEYLFQRWQHERDLRMSPAEIREELVRLEGSAEWKSKRRKIGQEILGREPTSDVKGPGVVGRDGPGVVGRDGPRVVGREGRALP